VLALIRDGAAFVARTPLVRGLVTASSAPSRRRHRHRLGHALRAEPRRRQRRVRRALRIGLHRVGARHGGRAADGAAHPAQPLFGAGSSRRVWRWCWWPLAPHLFLAIAAVMLVGAFAGIAFLTGLTIIGTQVADEIRGRRQRVRTDDRAAHAARLALVWSR
jgi:dTMP kinase